jgi:hypothetical protein
MKAYKGEIMSYTITHKITKLQQEKNKTINDFGYRCAKEIYDVSKHYPLPDEAYQDAAFVALTAAQKEKAHRNSVREMLDMFPKVFFLNGMKDALKVSHECQAHHCQGHHPEGHGSRASHQDS